MKALKSIVAVAVGALALSLNGAPGAEFGFSHAAAQETVRKEVGTPLGEASKLVKAGKIEEARHLLADAADFEASKPPALPRYIVTDASVEALGEILIENPWGVLTYRDELNGLLRGLDKEGQEGARAFYLQGYDGNQAYTFDRIGRGRNLHIPAVCISLLGGIQPVKVDV